MNFLSPWFLLGALAIAGPILFHLIRRSVKERMQFSSLMFLKPTPPKMTRRRQIEHIGLLLLRCLCLAALAFGFARPFIAKEITIPVSASGNRQIIILVDTSASMRRENLWTQARSIAERYCDKASPADQVAVVAFDRQPRTLLSFAEWAASAPDQRATLAKQRLAAESAGWMGTQLGLALTSAAEQFAPDTTASPSAKDLVLISDLQEGARLEGLQGHDWPQGVKVIVERVDCDNTGNAGIEILPDATAADGAPRIRVINSRDATREKFRLAWDGASSNASELYLPAGQIRVMDAPKITSGAEPSSLVMTGDSSDFDNRAYYAAPQVQRLTTAWFGADSPEDSKGLRYYMQRIFIDTPRRHIEIAPPVVQSIFSVEALNQAAFALIAGPLAPNESAATRQWLASGKTALLVLTNAAMSQTLAALADVPGLQITEATGDFALLSQIDFAHPLFAPFADPRFSDFSRIHFWKHRRITVTDPSQIQVLARFDDGSPALSQLAVDKGALFILASGWNPADSQLALSSKFPPLLQTMFDRYAAGPPSRSQYTTGDAVSALASTGQAIWKTPSGKTLTRAAEKTFGELDAPGIYTASIGGTERKIAVNVPFEESRTSPMPPDELARLGAPLTTIPIYSTDTQNSARQQRLRESEVENHQKLWRWLIATALVLTLGETLLGGRLAGRIQTIKASP